MDQSETIQEIRERLVKIEMLLENITSVNKMQLMNIEEKIKVVNHRVDDLEKNNTWLWRSIGGAVIGAVMALILK